MKLTSKLIIDALNNGEKITRPAWDCVTTPDNFACLQKMGVDGFVYYLFVDRYDGSIEYKKISSLNMENLEADDWYVIK